MAVHCHGKINTILDKLMDMGAYLLDPFEGPPSGDIELTEAKKWVRGRMILVGNIQFSDLELCSPNEIDRKVKDAIYLGGKERFILASPIGLLHSYRTD